MFSLPGMWLQYLTTREPDNSMIEVAVKSLKAAIELEEVKETETKAEAKPSVANELKVNATI